jgi:transcriptional regulator with XRE-family HTH domain
MILDSIRLARLTKGYSQSYLAHKLNISQKAYSSIERGNTNLSLERFLQITDVLEIDKTFLLNEYSNEIQFNNS